jgi:hypothetical protein
MHIAIFLGLAGDCNALARREVKPKKSRSLNCLIVKKVNNARLSRSLGNLAVGHMHFDDGTTEPAARQTQGVTNQVLYA